MDVSSYLPMKLNNIQKNMVNSAKKLKLRQLKSKNSLRVTHTKLVLYSQEKNRLASNTRSVTDSPICQMKYQNNKKNSL